MNRSTWAVATILTGAALAAPVPYLEVGAAALPLEPGGAFTYEYRHSIYGARVREDLRATGGRIRLERVWSADRQALEYLRWPGEPIPDGAGLRLEAPDVTFDRLEVRVAREGEQVITSWGRQVRLLEVAEPGAPLTMRAPGAPLARWLAAWIGLSMASGRAP